MEENKNNNKEGISVGAENATAAPSGDGSASQSQKPVKGGSFWKSSWWAWLVVVLIIAGAAYAYTSGSNPLGTLQKGDAVALVNGEPVERDDFDARFNQIKSNLETQGEVTEEQLSAQREQLLGVMINTELMMQAARADGLSVSDERVETYYQDVVIANAGSEEALLEQLGETGFTADDLKEDIRTQFLVQDYIEAQAEEGELDVSEQESRDFYDQIVASQGGEVNMPDYANLKQQIDAQLAQQKQNEIVNRLVQELRADADIERLL